MDTPPEYVEAALQAWAPGYPRRATKYQKWATSIPEAVELVLDAEDTQDDWPFISTYSFPHGHTTDNVIPKIDRLFFDFDVPSTGEYRSGDTDKTAWARDMSRLLVRARKVARFLLDANDPDCWQAVLSGHKGVHLDLVFPALSPVNGDYDQFRIGMGTFADSIVDYLSSETDLPDLETYVDVSSEDLARLRRVPNTKHRGASESFGEDRFCVPVSLRELAEIGPAEYVELTRSRRRITSGMRGTPNEKAGESLTQHVRTATGRVRTANGSTVNVDRIEKYVEDQNENIGVSDLDFVMTHRPCVTEFIKRDDAFAHQSASHLMEMFAITNMMEKKVPIEVEYDDHDRPRVVGGTMVAFFEQHETFDKNYTCGRIEEYISRSYNPVSCEKIWNNADQFCLKADCHIYQEVHKKA